MFPTASDPSSAPRPTSSSPTENGGSSRSAASAAALHTKIRRRNRQITSCLECRRRKLKCDKQAPCANCTRFSRECLFIAPALDAASQQKLAEIKEKMGTLERTIEQDIVRSKGSRARNEAGSKLPGQDGESDEEDSMPEDEKDLVAAPLSFQDAAYGEDVDDDVVDLGVQIGKMRVSDRIGGFFRPKMFEEMADVFKKIPGIDAESIEHSTKSPSTTAYQLGPGSDYLAPASGFFFAAPTQHVPLLQYLPSKVLADRLILQYWSAVHPVCKVLHRPSFERQYAQFWQNAARIADARPSFMALLLSLLFSAVISKTEDEIRSEFQTTKEALQDNFREGTEQALSRANVLRTTKLETLQAFVIYLIPLCRSAVSRVHATLTATAIRLALCMGLHRDGSHFGLPPVETHVRRLIWYQLCFLDIRTCEACGPRPQIRTDDFDTCPPLNVDDAHLESPNPPEDDLPRFTDNTLMRVRSDCTEMNRLIWFERPKMEKKGKVSLTWLVGKVEKFRKAMETLYYPMLDLKNPLHFFTMQVYNLLTYRMHIAILHRYSSNAQRIMPDRLRNQMMSTGTLCLEHAITIETHPGLKQWSWYSGALNGSWQIALLLMGELYAKPPQPRDEARIWRCLDYAFELPSHLTPAEKGRLVLGDLQEKTAVYQKLHMHTPKLLVACAAGSKPPPSLVREASVASSGSGHTNVAASQYSPTQHRTHGHTSSAIHSQPHHQQQTHQQQAPTSQPQLPMQPAFPPMPYQTQSQRAHASTTAAYPQQQHQPAQPSYEVVGAMPTTEFQMSTLPGGTGDAYYAPPMQQQRLPAFSPASLSDTSSGAQQQQQGKTMPTGGSGGNDPMLDIDWNEWDRLFPLQGTTGNDLNIPTNDVTIPPFSYPPGGGGNINW